MTQNNNTASFLRFQFCPGFLRKLHLYSLEELYREAHIELKNSGFGATCSVEHIEKKCLSIYLLDEAGICGKILHAVISLKASLQTVWSFLLTF